ncbi:hypothetical protein KJ765_05640 [Candidatus Micrarchaeota archaeon]|nr:hypothetical protein [Candidatus Micrarchaeota archaeon]
MRKAFEKRDLTAVLEQIGSVLSKPIEVFLLGGGAMVFRDQKTATKDLDLVFVTDVDCKAFISAIEKIGFKPADGLETAYLKMEAAGIWHDKNGFRFDLFVRVVCGCLELMPSIEKRAEVFGEFGRLKVRTVSNEDVILFKSITERPDDVDDIAAIVRTSKIDWKVILEECQLQSAKRSWHGLVCNKFNELAEKHGIDAPIRREVCRLDRESVVREAFGRRIKSGMDREAALTELRKMGFTKGELSNL